MQEAIDKLRAEMKAAKGATKDYVKYIGEYLITHLEKNPQHSAQILKGKKTIEGSLAAMRSAASKKKVGNMAVLTPDQGIAVVMEYYNIQEKPELKVVSAKKKVDIEFDDIF